MDSSAKLMKATGIIHIIHGLIIGLVFFFPIMMEVLSASIAGFSLGMLLLAFYVAELFLHTYIGYGLFALRQPNKMRGLLIVSIILSCIQVVAFMMPMDLIVPSSGRFIETVILILKGEGVVGVTMVLIEFVMSIIAICNIGAYREYKNKVSERNKKDAEKENIDDVYANRDEDKHSDKEDESYDDEL